MKNINFIFITLIISISSNIPAQENFTFDIIRTSTNANSITGEIYINEKFVCHSLELPWKNNKYFISSIPAGEYEAILRYDKIVNKKVVGYGPEYWRIELIGTEPRTVIQIHKGNTPKEIEGCIIVGQQVENANNRLLNSKEAFKMLFELFYGTKTQNQTPNKNLKVRIRYKNTYTTLIAEKDNSITLNYRGSGLWSFKNNSEATWIEYKRDLKYIYITHVSGFYRYPIHGGIVEFSKDNKKWLIDNTKMSYIRKN